MHIAFEINIDEQLLRELEQVSAESGQSISDLVDQSLREMILLRRVIEDARRIAAERGVDEASINEAVRRVRYGN